MRFSLQLPTDRVAAGDEFVSGAAVAEMAAAIEHAGFDACFVTEHPFPPNRWLESGGHHALEPYVALAFAAAATTRLRLQTNIAVLAYRNPFLTAKAASSLDALSGGRVTLGVAAGYLKPEFEALGADFEGRNERTDEAIRALRLAFEQDGVDFSGEGFTARGHSMEPKPHQPRLPIWVGGNSRRAIRRAAELGDGWIPFPTVGLPSDRVRTAPIENLEQLRGRLALLREEADRAGRTRPLDVSFVPFGLAMHRPEPIDAARFADAVGALEELGVTWVSMSLAGRTRAEFCDRVAAAGEVLGAFREPDADS